MYIFVCHYAEYSIQFIFYFKNNIVVCVLSEAAPGRPHSLNMTRSPPRIMSFIHTVLLYHFPNLASLQGNWNLTAHRTSFDLQHFFSLSPLSFGVSLHLFLNDVYFDFDFILVRTLLGIVNLVVEWSSSSRTGALQLGVRLTRELKEAI